MTATKPFAYTVHVDFEDVSVADAYIAWLTGGHMQHVIDGGANRATLVQLGEKQIEIRYWFASPEAFAAYEKGPAVALRAEGTEKFPTSRGITYRRSTGTILATFPLSSGRGSG